MKHEAGSELERVVLAELSIGDVLHITTARPNGEDGMRRSYLQFLVQGKSEAPVGLMAREGVDIKGRDAYEYRLLGTMSQSPDVGEPTLEPGYNGLYYDHKALNLGGQLNGIVGVREGATTGFGDLAQSQRTGLIEKLVLVKFADAR